MLTEGPPENCAVGNLEMHLLGHIFITVIEDGYDLLPYVRPSLFGIWDGINGADSRSRPLVLAACRSAAAE